MRAKSFLLAIIALCLTLSSSAQSLKELLEGKAKYIVESSKDSSNVVDNTIKKDDSPISSVEADLVCQAVAPSLKLVKQQYRLQLGDDYFGADGNLHFGESVSLAVKVAGGTILQNKVLYPWDYDKDYLSANASGKYTPVLYRSFQKPALGGDYADVDFELNTPYVKQVGRDSLLYIHADVYNDFGLNMDTSSGEKKGYMLWMYEGEHECACSVEALALNATVDSTVIAMNPKNPDKILGGLYLIAVNERPGTLSFFLVGMASCNKNEEWFLQLFTREESKINRIN